MAASVWHSDSAAATASTSTAMLHLVVPLLVQTLALVHPFVVGSKRKQAPGGSVSGAFKRPG